MGASATGAGCACSKASCGSLPTLHSSAPAAPASSREPHAPGSRNTSPAAKAKPSTAPARLPLPEITYQTDPVACTSSGGSAARAAKRREGAGGAGRKGEGERRGLVAIEHAVAPFLRRRKEPCRHLGQLDVEGVAGVEKARPGLRGAGRRVWMLHGQIGHVGGAGGGGVGGIHRAAPAPALA